MWNILHRVLLINSFREQVGVTKEESKLCERNPSFKVHSDK